MEIFELSLDKLCSQDNKVAFEYLQELEQISHDSKIVYTYFEDFVQMLEDKHSFVRIRAFRLIAVNAKWDDENKLDRIIDVYLRHIEDKKAFVARQCVPYLPFITLYKPQLVYSILHVLIHFDKNRYQESMQSLIQKDIEQTIYKILENIEISYCGLMCHFCPIKIATNSHDNQLKEKLAQEYSTSACLFAKEDMNCCGCTRSEGINKKMCLECSLRNCALEKNVQYCGECSSYPCQIIDTYLSKESQQRQLLNLLIQYHRKGEKIYG